MSVDAGSGLVATLECPICLELYVDPCTLSCGHNFCLLCLKKTVVNEKDIFEGSSMSQGWNETARDDTNANDGEIIKGSQEFRPQMSEETLVAEASKPLLDPAVAHLSPPVPVEDDGRRALLNSIITGKALKKVITVDKSAARIFSEDGEEVGDDTGKTKNRSILCPTCRRSHTCKVTTMTGFVFVVNIALRNLIDEMKKIEIANKHGAARGGECANFSVCQQRSVMHCGNCNVYICKNCSAEHSKHFATRAHVLVDTSKKPLFPECKEHSDEKCKLYCESCEKLVCNSCISISHRNEVSHKIVAIADASNKKRKAIVDSALPFQREIATLGSTISSKTATLAQLMAQVKALEKEIPKLESDKCVIEAKVENLRRISNEPSDFDILDKEKYARFLTALEAQFKVQVHIPVKAKFDSTIIPDMSPYVGYFTTWLTVATNKNPSSWKRLYRGSVDGFAAAQFHAKCDNQGPTVTFIKSGAYVFGGYAPQAWDSTGAWKTNGNSFLFTIISPYGTGPTKYPYCASYSEYCNAGYGPSWGGGHDLHISNSPTSSGCYAAFPTSYSDTTGYGNNTFTGSRNFVVSEIEVFLVN